MKVRKYGIIVRSSSTKNYIGGGIHPFHYELLFISSGRTKLHCLGDVFETEGLALFLMPPNTPHQFTNISPHYSYLYMELEMDHSDGIPSNEQLLDWNRLQISSKMDSPLFQMIYQTVENLYTFLRSDVADNNEFYREVSILDIKKVLFLVRQALENVDKQPESIKNKLSEKNEQASQGEIIESITRFMEAHYMQNISLKLLSELANFAPSYFIRLFKAHKGMTPFQYLNEIRINAALSYLANNNMLIQEVVEATGYQSIHYFSRLFKQKYGMSPAKWRSNQHSNV
jgi:AraC-like DNA-binding protein